MKIVLQRKNESMHFEAANEEGNTVQIDGSPEIGGEGKGTRPMQLLIMGLGGCSAIDVLLILKKQREVVKDLKITIDADRQKDAVPALFETINIHFEFFGELNPKKVERAIDLSLDKYCSVAKTLEKTAKITHTYSIIN